MADFTFNAEFPQRGTPEHAKLMRLLEEAIADGRLPGTEDDHNELRKFLQGSPDADDMLPMVKQAALIGMLVVMNVPMDINHGDRVIATNVSIDELKFRPTMGRILTDNENDTAISWVKFPAVTMLLDKLARAYGRDHNLLDEIDAVCHNIGNAIASVVDLNDDKLLERDQMHEALRRINNENL